MQQSKQSSAFLVRDGEVLGVDPMVVLLEVADGRCELLCTDQLEGWFGIGDDGIARALRAPTRQHSRRALRHVRSAIRGQRTLCTIHGQAT
jgi:hypothetical protein